jgi:hypothetical protein
MSILLSPVLNEQQFDANGDPLAGGFIYTYLAGTTTQVTTYKTSAGTAHSNPIVLDSSGYFPTGTQLWLDSGRSYKFVVQNSAGVTIRTIDNITPINDTIDTVSEWVQFTASTPTYVNATRFSVVGDYTSTFQVGRRIQSTNTGGTIYSTISASSYSAPDTSVTLVNDSGTLDSGLSAVSYGIISPLNGSLSTLSGSGANATLTLKSSSTGKALVIDNTGTGDSLVVDTNAFVVDTNGKVVVNHSVPISALSQMEINAQGSTSAALRLHRWASSGTSTRVGIYRSMSNTIGTQSAVSNGNFLGSFESGGSDGTQFSESTSIVSVVDGSVSSGIVPGRLLFNTVNASGIMTTGFSIDASQNKFFGSSSTTTDYTGGLVDAKYISGSTGSLVSSRSVTSSVAHAQFHNPNGQVGAISTSASATTYATSSDYRLKEFVVSLSDSGEFIDALRPRRWKWKVDGTDGVGFIAHELQAVSPSSVVGQKDEVDEDGKPLYQAVEYGSAEVIAHLVAEVKSLRQRVAALEAA